MIRTGRFLHTRALSFALLSLFGSACVAAEELYGAVHLGKLYSRQSVGSSDPLFGGFSERQGSGLGGGYAFAAGGRYFLVEMRSDVLLDYFDRGSETIGIRADTYALQGVVKYPLGGWFEPYLSAGGALVYTSGSVQDRASGATLDRRDSPLQSGSWIWGGGLRLRFEGNSGRAAPSSQKSLVLELGYLQYPRISTQHLFLSWGRADFRYEVIYLGVGVYFSTLCCL